MEIRTINILMPIILKKESRNAWLKGDALENFQFPYEVDLTAQTV